MARTLEAEPMTKPKGRPRGDRDDVPVKIDRALALKAKLIAADKGVSVARLVSDALQAPLDKMYGALLKKMEEKP
jgi:hypothetical protein